VIGGLRGDDIEVRIFPPKLVLLKIPRRSIRLSDSRYLQSFEEIALPFCSTLFRSRIFFICHARLRADRTRRQTSYFSGSEI